MFEFSAILPRNVMDRMHRLPVALWLFSLTILIVPQALLRTIHITWGVLSARGQESNMDAAGGVFRNIRVYCTFLLICGWRYLVTFTKRARVHRILGDPIVWIRHVCVKIANRISVD